MTHRFYSNARRAWTPRFWPLVIVCFLLVQIPVFLWTKQPVLILLSGVVIGVGVPSIRIAIWRHRHPSMSADEQIEEMRKNAWLN